MSFQTIPSGPSGFLIVTFQRFGYIVVNHIPHVRFVNAHPKSDGSYNDIQFFIQKIVLGFDADRRIQTCMIRCRIDLIHFEQFGDLFHLFSAEAVDDSRFAFVLLDEFDQGLFGLIFDLGANLIKEIGPVKRRFEQISFFHLKITLNVLLNLGSGSGSQGDDRKLRGYLGYDRFDLSVLRSEIMTPFRNAVCLIYGNKTQMSFL